VHRSEEVKVSPNVMVCVLSRKVKLVGQVARQRRPLALHKMSVLC